MRNLVSFPFATTLWLVATIIAPTAAAPSGSIVVWGCDDSGPAGAFDRGQCDVPDGNDFVALAGGGTHSLALKTDGTVVAWGENLHGQCDVPADFFQAIDAGSLHSLALRLDGSLAAWGSNWNGLCEVPEGNDYVAIAAGQDYHNLALRLDGTLVAWGESPDGQCDVPAGNNFVAIAAGRHHSVALRVDGSLASWGWGGADMHTPTDKGYLAIAAGHHHALALKVDGTVVAWGLDWAGQCSVPQRRLGNDVVGVETKDHTSLALTSDGSVVAWGYLERSLGDVPPDSGYVAIDAGIDHVLALKAERPWYTPLAGDVSGPNDAPDGVIDAFDFAVVAANWGKHAESATTGSIIAWGEDGQGQCSVPDGNDFVAVAAGNTHSLALRSDGTLASWGMLRDVPSGQFKAIAAGEFHNLGLRTDGTLVTWGLSNEWQTPPGHDFVAIACGWWHCLALRADGSIVAWGENWDNQLDTVPPGNDFVALAAGKHLSAAIRADGSVVPWGAYRDPPAGRDYVAIACGQHHGLALTAGGTVVEWANPHSGPVPQRQLGSNVVAVSTHDSTNLALKSDGTLVVWGWTNHGQNNIPDVDNVAAIAAGDQHCLALRAEGVAYEPLAGDISGPAGVPDHTVNRYDWQALVEQWRAQRMGNGI